MMSVAFLTRRNIWTCCFEGRSFKNFTENVSSKGMVMKAYKGESSSSSNLIDLDYNIIGNKVYRGNSTSSSNLLCNVRGDKVYKGDGSSSSNLLFTLKDDKVYRGSSTTSSNMICNIKGNKVYKGSHSSGSHVLFNTTERFNTEQLASVLFALGEI